MKTSIFLVKGDLRFLAPKTQWFPQPFACGTAGSLAGIQSFNPPWKANLSSLDCFLCPILLPSLFNSKGKELFGEFEVGTFLLSSA